MKREISDYINWCHEKLGKLDSDVPTGHMMTEEVAETKVLCTSGLKRLPGL